MSVAEPPRCRKKRKPPGETRRMNTPGTKDSPFVIIPQIAPIIKDLVNLAGKEAGLTEEIHGTNCGIGILGARAAIVLGCSEEAAVRRLYAIVHRRNLFTKATFVEGVLMAMDAEHDYRYGEWPSSKAMALERVALEAEAAGKQLSPTKLLHQANKLYHKGIRKAYKRACEVNY